MSTKCEIFKKLVRSKGLQKLFEKHYGIIEYTITGTITNGAIVAGQIIKTGETKAINITPNSGYNYPASVTVTGATSSYNSATGVVTLSNPTGPVTITATCPVISYSITGNITNGSIYPGQVISPGETKNIQINPASGFTYPATVSVTGATLVNYDEDTGKVRINNPTDSVTITAACAYLIDYYFSGGTYDGPFRIAPGETVNITFTPDTGCVRPTGEYAPQVSGATSSYNEDTGVLTISNPTGDVTIFAQCPEGYYIATNVTNGTYSGAKAVTIGDHTDITITPNTGYSLLQGNITVIGCNLWTYNNNIISIYYSGTTSDVTITAVCTVALESFCFTAESGTPKISLNYVNDASLTEWVSMEYSTNDVNWSSYTMGTVITLSSVGSKLYFRGNYNGSLGSRGTSTTVSYHKFVITNGTASVSGDLVMLLRYLNIPGFTITNQYGFYGLFKGCTNLVNARNLKLVGSEYTGTGTTAGYMYQYMFEESGIVTPPSLSNITMVTPYMFSAMFRNCTLLTSIPALTAMMTRSVTGTNCKYMYQTMFYGCSLIKMSSTQTGEYVNSWRFLSADSDAWYSNAANNMFVNTGGTYVTAPMAKNTVLYTSNTIIE